MTAELPPYEVRESRRARRARIRVTPGGKVEVVIPWGFPRERVPELVAERRRWLAQAVAETHRGGEGLPERDPWPEGVTLTAVPEAWPVIYRAAGTERSGTYPDEARLLVAADDWPTARAGLQGWLHHRARAYLPPLARAVAAEAGHGEPAVRIGNQATRWGSCSTRGTISLNRNLLFLPPEQVRYLCVHEICHLKHPDHSAAFWREVARWGFDTRVLEQALDAGMARVPRWALPDRLLPAEYLAGTG